MPEVTETSYGQNIGKGFKSMLIGILLFLGSFVVLWYNAGRPDRGKIAETSEVINANTASSAALSGKFISLSGTLTSPELLGDSQFVKSGKYITLTRKVEMYAWKKVKHTKTEDKVGGGTKTTTWYTYEKVWTSSPDNNNTLQSVDLKDEEKKTGESIQNPSYMKYKGMTFKVSTANIGKWRIDPDSIQLPGGESLALSKENVVSGNKIDNGYIYDGAGTLSDPKIGDLRISFSALPSDIDVTAFGKVSGNTIKPYKVKQKLKNEVSFYRVFRGSREDAITTLKNEDKMMGIILIAVGFLMMWIGLSSLFDPLIAIMKVLPFLGNLGKGLIQVVTFIIAAVLTLVTVAIFGIFRNVVALIVVLGLLIVIFAILMGKRKKVAIQS